MKEKTINTLRVERAIHRLTQRQLASGVNCSLQTISAIENGKFNTSIRLALQIVRFLNELKLEADMKLIITEDIFKLEKL